MPKRKQMTDIIQINRSSEIHLNDESIIDLNLTICLSTDAVGCIANDRLNSTSLTKTLALIEHMLITACQCSTEEMAEMVKQHGIRKQD